MLHRTLLVALVIFLLVLNSAAQAADAPPAKPWLGIHVSAGNKNALDKLGQSLPALSKLGVNALIIEINYSFHFQSHPELAGPITKEEAKAFADLCRANGIRPIPGL